MIFFVESDLILKRPFPGSFVVARVSGGDQKNPGNLEFFFKNVDIFSLKNIDFRYFDPTEIHLWLENLARTSRDPLRVSF